MSDCGFTVPRGIEYLTACGNLDECARDFFAQNPEIAVEVLKEYLTNENEWAVKVLRDWCTSDNEEYWKEFLEERGYTDEG